MSYKLPKPNKEIIIKNIPIIIPFVLLNDFSFLPVMKADIIVATEEALKTKPMNVLKPFY